MCPQVCPCEMGLSCSWFPDLHFNSRTCSFHCCSSSKKWAAGCSTVFKLAPLLPSATFFCSVYGHQSLKVQGRWLNCPPQHLSCWTRLGTWEGQVEIVRSSLQFWFRRAYLLKLATRSSWAIHSPVRRCLPPRCLILSADTTTSAG